MCQKLRPVAGDVCVLWSGKPFRICLASWQEEKEMFIVCSVVTWRRLVAYDTTCVYYCCGPGACSEHQYEIWKAMVLGLGGIFRVFEPQEPKSSSLFAHPPQAGLDEGPRFELMRVKPVQAWEQQCHALCRGSCQELLLPGWNILFCNCYSVCTQKLIIIHLIGKITAFSMLCRLFAGLTVPTSKAVRLVHPMGGLAPPAELSPHMVPCVIFLLLSTYRLTAFKSITILLPVFVSS